MRFTETVVAESGAFSSKHAKLPHRGSDNTVTWITRMDPGEKFRVMFENDWESPGKVRCEYYDEQDETHSVEIDCLEPGEFVCGPVWTYQYTRTPGAGRIIRTTFYRKGADPTQHYLVLVNNDYKTDGTCVHFTPNATPGEVYEKEDLSKIVPGRVTSKLQDPDRNQWANSQSSNRNGNV